MGSSTSSVELQAIASSSQFVFEIKEYSKLSLQVDTIAERICNGKFNITYYYFLNKNDVVYFNKNDDIASSMTFYFKTF